MVLNSYLATPNGNKMTYIGDRELSAQGGKRADDMVSILGRDIRYEVITTLPAFKMQCYELGSCLEPLRIYVHPPYWLVLNDGVLRSIRVLP